uniref:RING finger family protein n=1 Tax=Clandestinovirus TaxID=2831644 RepID=A0A8F8KU60_9VIRU|nr:RING finger family protein [Clandestinovirus]
MKSILKSKFVFAIANGNSQISIAQFNLSNVDGTIKIVLPAPKCLVHRTNVATGQVDRTVEGAQLSLVHFGSDASTERYIELIDKLENLFGWPKEWWIDANTIDQSWKSSPVHECIPTSFVDIYQTKQAMLEATSTTNNVKFIGDMDQLQSEYIVITFSGPTGGWTIPVAWTHQNKQLSLFVPRAFAFPAEIICIGAADDYATCGDVSIRSNYDEIAHIVELFAPVQVKHFSLMQPYVRRIIYRFNSSVREQPGCNDVFITRENLMDSPSCTKVVTNEEYALQPWFECVTCGLSGGSGCCVKCIDSCHQGHQVIPRGFSMFFCDCPSTGHCTIASRQPSSARTITNPLYQVD